MDCEALEATAMPHDGSPRVLRVLLIASLAELPSLGPASGWTLGLVDFIYPLVICYIAIENCHL